MRGLMLSQESPSPVPTPTTPDIPIPQLPQGQVVALELALAFMVALVILMPTILLIRDRGFFQVPYASWFLIHFGIPALAVVAILMLAFAGVLSSALIALFASLFGYLFGASTARGRDSADGGKQIAINSLKPSKAAAGATVTISGRAFDSGAKVMVGTVWLTDVAVKADGSQLTGTVPAGGGTGKLDVLVRNPNGAAFVYTNGFEYTT